MNPRHDALPYDDDARAVSPLRRHAALSRVWATGRGWRTLASVNHNQLGIRFLVASFVFFAIGGLLAMLIRAQLATPGAAFLGPDIYNQVFTMHGTVMMFLFAIPVLEGLAIYLLPKLLGARDMAFPRLTAFGFWCYILGGTIIVGSMLFAAAPDSGWFMYTPLSSNAHSPGIHSDVWLLGVTFVEISAVSFAVETLTSILKLRAPGMSLERMPILAWYILGAAAMMLVGFPPLILGSILLELERAAGLPFFDPARGGDALLWQHLFWLFGHPEVYIILLPAAGCLSTIIPVFARRPLVGYVAVIVAIVGMVFLSMGIWVHHMFTVGIPHLALAFFSLASVAVAVPTAVQVFAWLGTLASGTPRWRLPMLFVSGFFIVFVCGGLTGVMLAIVPFNTQAHDSYFVVAHLHYVLTGGLIFPLLAGIYYWLPHRTGRLPGQGLAVAGFWTLVTGFTATFFLMHLTGLLGMPRRIYTYRDGDGWTALNLLSSVGGFVLTIGFAIIAIDIILQLRGGRRYRRDPWDAGTLEWATPTPPPLYTFGSLPQVDRRADQLQPATLGPQLAAGQGYLGGTRHGWQETLGVEMASGRIDQFIVLPRSTWVPLWQALLVCAVVLCLLFKLYAAAGVLALAAAAGFVWGARDAGLPHDHGALPIGRGQHALPHTEAAQPPPLVALRLLLVADGALLTSLVFGVFYLWFVAPASAQPAGLGQPATALAGVAWLLLAGAAGAPRAALVALRRAGGVRPAIGCHALAAALSLAALPPLALFAQGLAPAPTTHAAQALVVALVGYVALHAFVGALFGISTAWRAARGYVSARRTMDVRLTRLWLDYTAATGLLCLGLAWVLPQLHRMAP